MTRDEERRLEVAELFEGLSVFDRYPGGYMLTGTWLAPARPRYSPDERRSVRAARENARYHALSPEEKRERNMRQYKAMKARPGSLAKVREQNREYMREKRARLRAQAAE